MCCKGEREVERGKGIEAVLKVKGEQKIQEMWVNQNEGRKEQRKERKKEKKRGSRMYMNTREGKGGSRERVGRKGKRSRERNCRERKTRDVKEEDEPERNQRRRGLREGGSTRIESKR